MSNAHASERQIAVNSRALMAAAAKVERIGYEGDAYRFVESLVLSVLADGFERIEPVPPPRAAAELGGPGHREFQEAREALKRSKR